MVSYDELTRCQSGTHSIPDHPHSSPHANHCRIILTFLEHDIDMYKYVLFLGRIYYMYLIFNIIPLSFVATFYCYLYTNVCRKIAHVANAIVIMKPTLNKAPCIVYLVELLLVTHPNDNHSPGWSRGILFHVHRSTWSLSAFESFNFTFGWCACDESGSFRPFCRFGLGRSNQSETTHQIWPKRPRAETTQSETTWVETTQGRNDSGPKRPGTPVTGGKHGAKKKKKKKKRHPLNFTVLGSFATFLFATYTCSLPYLFATYPFATWPVRYLAFSLPVFFAIPILWSQH